MKDLGIYYIKEHDTIILGFKEPGKYRDKLVGRVIGHTIDREYFGFHAYNVGYEYHDWQDGYYLGRYTTFSTLKGYLEFLDRADYDTIKAYFKCKKQVEEYMKSYVVFRRNNGVSWFERRYKS